MSVERTLSIIKPDAVGKNVIGEIVSRFEKGDLKVIAMKMLQLDEESAAALGRVNPRASQRRDRTTRRPRMRSFPYAVKNL